MFSHTQETDSRFKALAKALSLCLSKENISPVMPGAQFQAAVSVVLRSAEGLDLLLIKRAHFDRDPWSGHMALPGGHRDPKDIDLKHTSDNLRHWNPTQSAYPNSPSLPSCSELEDMLRLPLPVLRSIRSSGFL